jgi:hypothetical protein
VRRRTFKSVFPPRIAPAQRVGDAEGARESVRTQVHEDGLRFDHYDQLRRCVFLFRSFSTGNLLARMFFPMGAPM